MASSNAVIYETVYKFPIGTKFTGPDVRGKIPQKVDSSKISTSLNYLKKIGTIRIVQDWDGTNFTTYEMVDPTKRVGSMGGPRGFGLYKFRQANHTMGAAKTIPQLLNTIDHHFDQVEELFTKVAVLAGEAPRSSLSSFSTKELLDEISARTIQTAPNTAG